MEASNIAFNRGQTSDHFVELALHAIEPFLLSREACSHEVENLEILGHYAFMRSPCRVVVGDDGLEPPTLSV